MLNYHSFE